MSRLDKLKGQLGEQECDAFLITDEINVHYLSSFTGDSSALLVTSAETTMLSDGRYQEQLKEECPTIQHAIKQASDGPLKVYADVMAALGVRRVGVEADQLTLSMFAKLKKAMPEVDWVQTSGIVEDLRAIKDDDEIETIRRSAKINERALTSVLAKIGPDWTEKEIVDDLEQTIRRLGASGFSFAPIVGAGPGGAKPHYSSGLEPIGPHGSLLIDWGTKLGGYASDITRTFHFGEPTPKFASAYQAVLDSQLAAIEAIGPGVSCREIDQTARKVLEKAGFGEFFIHGLGHGVGLQIHESPRLSAVSEDVLRPGMVITVEPGVYFEGEFGIRIEDDVLVTETGFEVLTTLPKGLDDCRLIL